MSPRPSGLVDTIALSIAIVAWTPACAFTDDAEDMRGGYSSAPGGSGGSAAGSGTGGVGAQGSGAQGSGAQGSGAQGSGAGGGIDPTPCNEHTFSYVDASASTVWVTGTFSSWATAPAEGALELTNDGSGNWSLTVELNPPGEHEYKFIVDGSTWVTDPSNPVTAPDGVGGNNSVVTVCGSAGECGDVAEFDWRDAVMYFAMVDRFRNSDGQSDPVPGASGGPANGPSGQYAGGDLAGVTEKLGYLADLGVTAVWLSAPYENRNGAGAAIDPGSDSHQYSAYHGYWPSPANTDYSNPASPSPRPSVESRIGTDTDLRTMVDTAHATTGADGHGMKVLFDYVMNHVDIDSGLYQAHPDWFAKKQDGSFALCGPENLWEDPFWGTRCAFTSYLPPFDFDNAAARKWSVDDALWWATEYGIDGYRLDAIKHVPLSWLTDLRSRLTSDIPSPAGGRFYLVGETFSYDDRDLLKSFVDPGTMLDGQFDFPYKARLCEAVFTPEGGLHYFSDWADGNDYFYGPGAIMSTWIGNHDVPRAIHWASRQIGNCREGSSPGNGWAGQSFGQPADAAPYERLGVAFAIMLTSPGVPLIYYGDEIGLAGGGDPDNRREMVWNDSELNAHQLALRSAVSVLGQIRGQNRVLSRGSRTTHSVSQDTWVYSMRGCDEPDVVVAVNRADQSSDVSLPAGTYEDLVAGGSVGGTVSLAPRSFLVARAQ